MVLNILMYKFRNLGTELLNNGTSQENDGLFMILCFFFLPFFLLCDFFLVSIKYLYGLLVAAKCRWFQSSNYKKLQGLTSHLNVIVTS